jgi:hypothetical protein
MGALVSLLGGDSEPGGSHPTLRISVLTRPVRFRGHEFGAGYCGDTNLGIAAIPKSVYPSGPPGTFCLGYLWHPYTSRWSRAVVVFRDLLFELIDPLRGHHETFSGLRSGDRIMPTKACTG